MTSDACARPHRAPAPWAALALGAVLGVVWSLAGCTTETKRTKRPPAPWQQTGQGAARRSGTGGAPRGERPDQVADPCATRLHDLSGLLLLYYAVNKKLPERLEELEPFADADVQFHPECPVSGVPYVYAPAAVPPAGSQRFLVLYDAVPAHGGLRWGVFIAPPVKDQPPATWVILMSETVFRNYVPR